MLRAYVRDSWLPSQEQQRGAKLLYLIMNEQIRPQPLVEYVLYNYIRRKTFLFACVRYMYVRTWICCLLVMQEILGTLHLFQ